MVALLFLAAEFCFGQAPGQSLSVPNLEIYGGYIVTFPDYGPDFDSRMLDGAELAFSKALTPHYTLIASAVYVAGSSVGVKQISVTGGMKYNILTGGLRPYLTGQIGYAYQHSHGFYAADYNPPLPPGTVMEEQGFTARLGGGLDLRLTEHLSWRVAQWDFQPVPFGPNTPIYQNASTGLGWHF